MALRVEPPRRLDQRSRGPPEPAGDEGLPLLGKDAATSEPEGIAVRTGVHHGPQALDEGRAPRRRRRSSQRGVAQSASGEGRYQPAASARPRPRRLVRGTSRTAGPPGSGPAGARPPARARTSSPNQARAREQPAAGPRGSRRRSSSSAKAMNDRRAAAAGLIREQPEGQITGVDRVERRPPERPPGPRQRLNLRRDLARLVGSSTGGSHTPAAPSSSSRGDGRRHSPRIRAGPPLHGQEPVTDPAPSTTRS